jgi:hypothetical protein
MVFIGIKITEPSNIQIYFGSIRHEATFSKKEQLINNCSQWFRNDDGIVYLIKNF